MVCLEVEDQSECLNPPKKAEWANTITFYFKQPRKKVREIDMKMQTRGVA